MLVQNTLSGGELCELAIPLIDVFHVKRSSPTALIECDVAGINIENGLPD